MQGQWDVLVASSDIEHRRLLVKILDALNLNVISCGALREAADVLSRQGVDLVFCDEQLPDGSYRDLLAPRRSVRRTPRLVVTIRTGEWEEYLEAMRLGAFDAVRRPLHPTDIEMVVLRAMHGEERQADRMIA
jgi:DNA-binding NtrC family response regulator